MSPSSTIPAEPNQQSYPLSDLNLFPTLTFETVPAGATFNPASPQKLWIDPAASALVAAGFGQTVLTYGAWVPSNGTIAYNATALQMTAAAAATCNVPPNPAMWPTPPNALLQEPGYAGPPMLTPARPLAANESGPSSLMGGGDTWMVVRTDMTATTPAADPTETRMLNGVNALLKLFNQPTV